DETQRDPDHCATSTKQETLLQALSNDYRSPQPDGAKQPDLPGACLENRSEARVADHEARKDGQETKGGEHRLKRRDALPHNVLSHRRLAYLEAGGKDPGYRRLDRVHIGPLIQHQIDLVDPAIRRERTLRGVEIHHDETAAESAGEPLGLEEAANRERLHAGGCCQADRLP